MNLQVQVKIASRAAGISTASMGKFDRRAAGEKDGERAPMGKRRKLAAVVDSSGKERTSQVRRPRDYAPVLAA